ncbi:galactose-binding lectin l-1-like [Conger conger]|uniref:galactose-binding lectin l-1-like n=1 Tax=Conger conger TaxID=82655 RepID=UPI002A59BD17|nr:galactose-binding lectin l-1-like [Conger conger]
MELKVSGVIKPDPIRFMINVGRSMENIALHFNPRFNIYGDVRTIVMNSKEGNSWKEEQRDGNFPFEAGKEFEVTIVFNFDTFDIYLANGDKLQFPNRLGDKKYKYIYFGGDATIQRITVEPSKKPTKR